MPLDKPAEIQNVTEFKAVNVNSCYVVNVNNHLFLQYFFSISHNFQNLHIFHNLSYDLGILQLIFGWLLFRPAKQTSQDNRLWLT